MFLGFHYVFLHHERLLNRAANSVHLRLQKQLFYGTVLQNIEYDVKRIKQNNIKAESWEIFKYNIWYEGLSTSISKS